MGWPSNDNFLQVLDINYLYMRAQNYDSGSGLHVLANMNASSRGIAKPFTDLDQDGHQTVPTILLWKHYSHSLRRRTGFGSATLR
jgi:hypothetical protein